MLSFMFFDFWLVCCYLTLPQHSSFPPWFSSGESCVMAMALSVSLFSSSCSVCKSTAFESRLSEWSTLTQNLLPTTEMGAGNADCFSWLRQFCADAAVSCLFFIHKSWQMSQIFLLESGMWKKKNTDFTCKMIRWMANSKRNEKVRTVEDIGEDGNRI